MRYIFDDEKKDLNTLTKKFLKQINSHVSQRFKKIRITNNKRNKEIDGLFDKRRILMKEDKEEKNKTKLADIDNKLAEKCGQQIYDGIQDEINGIDNDGGYNPAHLWKLKKKLRPTIPDPPAAMKDSNGKLVTSVIEVNKIEVNHFKKVLENKEIKPELATYQKEREDLCMKRLEEVKKNKTPPWKMEDLLIVLKQLKKKKSRDPLGYANELFDPNTSGNDLLEAILKLMNKIKSDQVFPDCLRLCNVSKIYKRKGSRCEMDSYRGVFRIEALRNILDLLMYNDEYATIDANLTDCNVGSRKRRNIRDNIFVLGAVMNSAKNNNSEPIDVNVYDVHKCFDELWLQESINDLYTAGLKNDNLNLIYLTNESAQVAVKNSQGISERFAIHNKAMQGTVWAGLMCTVTMDKLGKVKYETENMCYKYKGEVQIPALEMVDDIVDIQNCGVKSVESNALINGFMESKKLRLSLEKCKQIHCGKNVNKCPTLQVHDKEMHKSEEERYLGDTISKTGKLRSTISKRRAKGYGIVSDILGILRDIPCGKRRIELGVQLRNAWLINSMLLNCEAWHNILKKDLDALIEVDNYLLRKIVGSHSKIPMEFVHLESGTLAINYICTKRRLMYLHHILNVPEHELIHRVYSAQKESPVKGDWVLMAGKDMEHINLNMEEKHIQSMSKSEYKKIVEEKVTETAFFEYNKLKSSKSKTKDVQYSKLKMQPYMRSVDFNNKEVKTLFNLRAKTVWNYRA